MAKKKQNGAGNVNEENSELYQDIVQSSNILIWRTDTEGRFTFLNSAWERNLGYVIGDMLGKPFSDFMVQEAAEHYINVFRNCLIGEPVTGHEANIYTESREELHLAVNMTPLLDDGAVIGTQGMAFDMTERKHADDLLQFISAKDEHTGLYNLHTFMSMTEQQIKAAQREKSEMLIIYTGIDGMQVVNEVYGNDAGDRIIIDTANILRKTFREADILARTGGDEFVVSTIVASRDHDGIILSRMQKNIDEYNADKTDLPPLSLSIGTALYDPSGSSSIEDALSRADDSMHDDKESKKA